MEIGKGTLGIIAAVGIAAGAAGAPVAGRVWEPARQAVPGLEAQAVSSGPVALPPSAAEPPAAVAPAQTRRPSPVARPTTARATAPRAPVEPAGTARPAAEPVLSPSADPRPIEPAPPASADRAETPVTAPVSEREPEIAATVEEPRYEDLVLPAQGVIGIQLDRLVSSETARVEDEVFGHVTRDVRVGDRVAIPAGSRATGVVTLAERGGRLKDRARLGVRFTSVALADGSRVPIDTEPIFREGDSPRNESAAKIGGGAIGGAILGGILGGAKGAAIGGSIGAGAGSTAVLTGGRNAATLPAGAPITVRLAKPATVTVER
jgi:hypothetical protein